MPRPASLFNHQRYEPRTQQALLELGVTSLKPLLSLLLAVLLVFTCTDEANRGQGFAWLGLATGTTLLGLWYCHHWRERLQQVLSPAELRRAEWWGMGYGVMVALLWGSSSQFMVPGHASANLMIAMIYFGVAAGAASLSVLGMAHMGLGALVAFLLFVLPLPRIFPGNWIGFMVMVALYHLVILMSSWQRHQITARNLILTQEQETLLETQRHETRRANQANQDKSAFLAAASHDLRQPVHAIMLLGHALRLKTVGHPEAATLVEQVLAAGKALSDQFNSLMELSRLESGNYALNPGTAPLDDFLHRILQRHREVASSRQLRLDLALDTRLRQASLECDLGLLTRVLDNLLDNALKFSAPGQRILLWARLRQGHLQLAVQDRGQGIAPEAQERIFLPYVQLDNPTRERSRGIGLGLSIVKEACALLQAELSLQSRPGRGSCFRISLPAETLRTGHTLAPSPVPPRARPSNTLQGKRLLIVEDDPMVAAALSTWASSQGMQVRHHADPRKVPPGQAPDLVVCDIRLPGEHDGIHWLSQWLAEWPDAGGVLVSGETSEAVQERIEQEGLLFLSKPVDPELLLHTLIRLTR